MAGWGSTFKIYTFQLLDPKAGISVCNNENYHEATMKYIPAKVWKDSTKGYGDYAQAQAEAQESEKALLRTFARSSSNCT